MLTIRQRGSIPARSPGRSQGPAWSSGPELT